MACGLIASQALAHAGIEVDDVVATLDEPAAALSAVHVELRKTLAPQLVVENKSGKTLEILDSNGKAFMRIGPNGVEADVASLEWQRSLGAGNVVETRGAPTAARNAPVWTMVSKEAAWGWFDARVKTDRVKVPYRVADAHRSAEVGKWAIPVVFDGRRMALGGTFRYAPPPAGRYEARMTGDGAIAPGVFVQLLPGETPGFLIENTSAGPITIMGSDGQPFLRIGAEGVEANVKSVSWLRSGQAEVSFGRDVAVASSVPVWQKRSTSPRFSWVEPRAAYAGADPPEALRQRRVRGEVMQWQIAFKQGERTGAISGVTDWVPFERAAKAIATSSPH